MPDAQILELVKVCLDDLQPYPKRLQSAQILYSIGLVIAPLVSRNPAARETFSAAAERALQVEMRGVEPVELVDRVWRGDGVAEELRIKQLAILVLILHQIYEMQLRPQVAQPLSLF